jgi:hypothetical protein
MTRLAKKVPVIWVNSIGMRAPAPGKTDLLFHRYLCKLRSTLKGLRRDPSGMWVYSPLFVPRYTRRWAMWNGRLLKGQLGLLRRFLGIRRPSAWITVPTAAHAVTSGSWVSLVFSRSDEFSSFPEVDGEFIQSLEDLLLDRADHVLYVNRNLLSRERGRVRDALYLGHGVDFVHFGGVWGKEGRAGPPPLLEGLARPVIGYYGALDDYTVDLPLLVRVARKVRPGTLLVIGRKGMDLSALEAEPNVRILEPVAYGDLPAYAAQFDVGIMPWLQNEWIDGCNPIKLKEYLALGFPIVTMDFPELKPYEALVYSAQDHESFLAGIDRALAERNWSLVERRKKSVAQDSWERLADRVSELLRLPA